MMRIGRQLGVLSAWGLLASAVVAEDPGAQSIPGARLETRNYRLEVFNAGHFAVQVGGSWMPGCVCLTANDVPQYRTEQLSRMSCRVEPLPGGRKVVIQGRLTPDFAFTETLLATEERLALTYTVEAVRDLARADLVVTAGPQLDRMVGAPFRIETAAGEEAFTYTPEAKVERSGVRAIVWPNVGKRDARTVFERCLDSFVRVAKEGPLYRARVFGPAPMTAGQRAEVELRIEAVPVGDAKEWVRMLRGRLGHLQFGVAGSAGQLHNLRTDRGLIIQHLSLNEEETHQVSLGYGAGKEWGGLRVLKEDPGREYAVTATGAIVNEWQEAIAARRVSPTVDELRLKAHRRLDQGPRRLRLLMYLAEWLEEERVPFRLRRPDGTVASSDRGDMLWVGMPPKTEEAGLGPYRVLGAFPAGTEVELPMLRRGEVMRLRFLQPMEVSVFRFDIYFRGLWFQAVDNETTDLEFAVQVERLPGLGSGPLSAWQDPATGVVSLAAGGLPLLGSIQAFRTRNGHSEDCTGAWEWRAKGQSASGVLTLPAGNSPSAVRMGIPTHLWGKGVTVRPPGGKPYAVLGSIALRLGADLLPVELPAGSKVEFAPTALERVALTCPGKASLQLTRDAAGMAFLDVGTSEGGLRLEVGYERTASPLPDPAASRPASPSPLGLDPGPYGGLEVTKDRPSRGDLTIQTPWWRVVHSRAEGGAITSLCFRQGSGQDLLRAPIATHLRAGDDFTDRADASARIEVLKSSPTYVGLRVTGHLKSAKGDTLCPFTHLYEYRPMLVRRTCTYDLGGEGVRCRGLSVGSMALAPWLDEAAARRGSDRTAWYHAIFPGPPAFEETDFSQYLCLFRRGVEGIDWVPACDLAQWQGFGTGKPGTARYAIEGDKTGAPVMVIEPLAMGPEPTLLKGEARFESYLSLPQTKRCLNRRNFVVCLNNGECTDDFLKLSAEHGVTDILLGAGNTPGTFELSDLRDSQLTVERARKYGLKVYPFDPFQLVHRTAPVWKNHEEWCRSIMERGKPVPAVFSEYGDYFCPAAPGFRDALRQGYTRLVESAGFGGLYHDFTHPYVCYNTKHYPTPHLNTDGVLDLVLWDREFLGKDRVFCGHTGWVPVLFFQDLCTVTAIFEEYPASEPLPLHLTPAQGEFVNAAPRALVSSFLPNGTVGPGEADHVPPPSDLVDAYLARCALVGIFPWAHSGNVVPADAYDLAEKMRPWYKLFALRGASDLSTMQFLPYHRETAAVTDTPYVRAATYWNRDEAIVVVANSESSEAHGFRLTILPERFGWPQGAKVTLAPSRYCAPLQPGGRPNTFGGRLHGFGFAAYHVRR